MSLFTKRSKTRSGLVCPVCGSRNLGLGYVDRVQSTVLHSCHNCGLRWRDDLVDLASEQLQRRIGV